MTRKIEQLVANLPAEIVCQDPAVLAPRLREWRDRYAGKTEVLLLPRDTAEVSAVLARCNALRVGVVPQGGNTGLCGGAIPVDGIDQVLLSLDRMNRIRGLNPGQYTVAAKKLVVCCRTYKMLPVRKTGWSVSVWQPRVPASWAVTLQPMRVAST